MYVATSWSVADGFIYAQLDRLCTAIDEYGKERYT